MALALRENRDMGALVRYDAACRALAAARSTDEVKQVRNHATALRAYAKQAKNKELEIDAQEIRIRAERRLGELITEQKQSRGLNQGAKGDKRKNPERGSKLDPRPTLLHPRTANPIENPYLKIRDRALAKLRSLRGIRAEWLW